jgi:hypothetical protein
VAAGVIAPAGQLRPVGSALVRLTPTCRDYHRRLLDLDGMVLHDSLALTKAIRPGIPRTTSMPLDVESPSAPRAHPWRPTARPPSTARRPRKPAGALTRSEAAAIVSATGTGNIKPDR